MPGWKVTVILISYAQDMVVQAHAMFRYYASAQLTFGHLQYQQGINSEFWPVKESRQKTLS
jgi:hypothetical protein